MKVLAYALTFYCLAALLACAGYGVRLGLDLKREQGALPALEQEHAANQRAVDSAHLAYRELAEQQRIERGEYSGADAIRMSYRVQQAREDFSRASAAAQASAEQLDARRQSIDRRQLQYVPLGGIVLLHVIGLLVFWPWRERRSPKAGR